MTFVLALKYIFELGIETYHEAQYEELRNFIAPTVEFTAPEIDVPLFKSPAVHLKSLQEVIQFWTLFNSEFKNRITKFEYLYVGKTSLVRCYYKRIGLVMDTEITFDNYGKVTKIMQQLVSE